jgi:ABC-type transporter Mla MlaB component
MNFSHTSSEEIYHRVYRLMKRNTAPPLIAAALNLPLRVVLNVISRLEKKPELGVDEETDPSAAGTHDAETVHFFNAYFITKARYGILQLAGHLVLGKKALIEEELQKAQSSVCKAFAIKMTEVVGIDETGAALLLAFCETMLARERFVALLDPPIAIEPLLATFHIEGKIPIFGTLGAFESGALSYKPGSASSKSKNRLKPR